MSKVYYNVKDIPKSYNYAVFNWEYKTYIVFRSLKQARQYFIENNIGGEIIKRYETIWLVVYLTQSSYDRKFI
jgi:hypothetical protein